MRFLASNAIAAIVIATTSLAHAQAPRSPAYKTFKDWDVGCDNLRGCIAFGAGERDEGYVRLARRAGPDAKPELKIVVDGKELADPRVVDPKPEEAADTLAALAAAARKAERVTLSDGKGERKATVSLAGASAAMLFIDDVQGRVGGVTALMRSGAKPASAVPPAAPPPAIKPVATQSFGKADEKLVAAVIKALPAAAKGCEGGEASALGGGTTLVILNCGGGAYNTENLIYLVRGGKASGATPIRVADPAGEAAAGAPSNVLTNAHYHPQSGKLSSFIKTRGIGDCGDFSVYAWTGRAFALESYRKTDKCLGVESDDWPVLWRAAE